MKQITIAIDGFSSCGKSTLARELANRLAYRYIDTGAMYRAVTLYFQRHQINYQDSTNVAEVLEDILIDFHPIDGKNHVFLNGEDVEDEIRTMAVSAEVSQVAALSPVRRALVAQQQRMGAAGGIVMDGRDIGTVVFPDAELKIFLTAEPEVRVERRYQELLQKNKPVTRAEVRENLKTRDRIDSTRADSPLSQAEDALVLDNSHFSQSEQLDLALEWAIERIQATRIQS